MIPALLIAIRIIYNILLVYIIASWIALFSPSFRFNIVYQFLHDMATPLLYPFRRLMPPMAGFDLSPILAFLTLIALESILRRL